MWSTDSCLTRLVNRYTTYSVNLRSDSIRRFQSGFINIGEIIPLPSRLPPYLDAILYSNNCHSHFLFRFESIRFFPFHMVRYLIDKNLIFENLTTCLCTAVKCNRVDVVKYIIWRESLHEKRSFSIIYALQEASISNNPKLLSWLFRKAKSMGYMKTGFYEFDSHERVIDLNCEYIRAFHGAIHRGYIECVKIIIREFPNKSGYEWERCISVSTDIETCRFLIGEMVKTGYVYDSGLVPFSSYFARLDSPGNTIYKSLSESK
jgi:hypothetical protein